MKKLSFFIFMPLLLCGILLLASCSKDPCAGGHTAVTDAALAATCTEPGLTEGSHCSVCNAVITAQETVPALGHTAGEWVTQIAPSCTQKGTHYNACTVCETLLTVETVNATGHTFGAWTQLTAPSCTAQGQKARTCSTCSVTETAAIAVLPHANGTPIVDVTPTCTTTGSQHYVCTVCESISKVEVITPTGHTLGAYTQTTAPTCNNAGIESATCGTCGESVKRALDASGHTASDWITDYAATCTSQGARHKACTACEAILATELTQPLTHAWSTIVLRAASCTQTGEQKRSCPNCLAAEYSTTPMADHTPGAWITDVPASCLSGGARHRICTTCNGITDAEATPKGAHVAGAWSVTVAPTATQAGESLQRCAACLAPMQRIATSLDGDVILHGTATAKSLVGYKIVYENGSDSLLKREINAMQSALNAATGLTIQAVAEQGTTEVEKEILIGATSRAESVAALAEIEGNGYTIRVTPSKIVIVGSDRLFTAVALQYFAKTYLNAATPNTSLSLHAQADAIQLAANQPASAISTSYKFVLDNDIDNDPQHPYVADSYAKETQGYVGDSRDYPALLMDRLISAISARSGLPTVSFPQITDTNLSFVNGYELLLGQVDRDECNALRSTLDAHEYGVQITANKIVITAHNDVALAKAYEAFLALYDYALANTGGRLPQGYRYVGAVTDQGWIMNFPRPTGENIALHGSQNNNNSSIQLLYTGTGVSVNAYTAYCQTLVNAGYTLVSGNDNPGSTGNYFRTYCKGSSHVLHVAYNAFSYESVYASSSRAGDHVMTHSLNSKTVSYPMLDYQPCIRIVSAPYASAYLPSNALLSKQSYTRVCESSVTAVRLIGGVGMSYIVQLEDGRFIVIDGGAQHSSYNNPKILYNVLTQLYRQAHNGSAPTASSPIHIAAWYITHSHSDHYDVAAAFLKSYGKSGLLKMDHLVGNFPEISVMYPVGGDTSLMGSADQIRTMQGYVTGGFSYVKVHTGQVLYFANLKMEVMMTYEDHFPNRITNSNDTNTVSKLTISSASKDTTWMILGDSCIYQSRWLCAMWGGSSYNTTSGLYENSYMAADMVQLAHHGNIGCEIAIYKTICPTVVWFPNTSSAYESYVAKSSPWPYSVDYFTCRQLSTVRYIVVSGMNSTSSTYTDSVTLQFTSAGPDYDNFWGVKSGQTGAFALGFSSSTTSCSGSPVIKK